MEQDRSQLSLLIVVLVLLWRMLNVLLLKTSFVPDEYWQGPEVAHFLAYGKGFLTWEWTEELRSTLHPWIYAALFKLLDLAKISSPQWIALAPSIFHGFVMAASDLHVYLLTRRMYGSLAAKCALFSSMCSWFLWYCGPRPLSGSLETLLLPIALFYWPLRAGRSFALKPSIISALFASLTCAIRPTCGVVWLVVGLVSAFNWLRAGVGVFLKHAAIVAFCLASVFGVTALLDYEFYGHWTFPPLNFVEFNLLSDGADRFGTHPWHWMFTSAVPVVFGPHLAFVLLGLRTGVNLLDILALIVLVIYSIPGHKEFRFIFAALLLLMPRIGKGMALWIRSSSRRKLWTAVLMFGVNAMAMAYFGMIHQRGPLAAISTLQSQHICQNTAPSEGLDVLYLLPCHTVPLYSHMHCPNQDIKLEFLRCSSQDHSPSEDVLSSRASTVEVINKLDPAFVLAFQRSGDALKHTHRYKQIEQFFHAHFVEDNQDQYMALWQRDKHGDTSKDKLTRY